MEYSTVDLFRKKKKTEALGDPENLLVLPRCGILGVKIFFSDHYLCP